MEFLLFTVFGMVCTLQVVRALLRGAVPDTETERLTVSWRYSFREAHGGCGRPSVRVRPQTAPRFRSSRYGDQDAVGVH